MARFRLNFFQIVCNHKPHPPKIVAVVHPNKITQTWSKWGQQIVLNFEKFSFCKIPFCKVFRICFEILHTKQKTHLMP